MNIWQNFVSPPIETYKRFACQTTVQDSSTFQDELQLIMHCDVYNENKATLCTPQSLNWGSNIMWSDLPNLLHTPPPPTINLSIVEWEKNVTITEIWYGKRHFIDLNNCGSFQHLHNFIGQNYILGNIFSIIL